ncbi:prevent-host-death family protein [Rhizobium sp. SG_E_25_P2]|jgi:prevent-host-death family protein|uniref:type II toxin-antitoxin system Phd/YefM family antitoxin n=1 Tax=Rhizobium sp. SG_E_25_P2 TaxID=2879942 RepID=UPI002474108C|nr:type II toxin-antitoxin system prevent-host-death family antitoxin [Rhizobium sp. SG_E_25_P2]MDH6269436.1 prevent-host-death family protein [Rhizobium sp. SG_E_25_P2]
MASVGVKEAKAALSGLVDEAASGVFVTITRHGKPAAVLVSLEAAEAARRALAADRPSLVDHLKRFPVDIDLDDEIFSRNRMPSREIDL